MYFFDDLILACVRVSPKLGVQEKAYLHIILLLQCQIVYIR